MSTSSNGIGVQEALTALIVFLAFAVCLFVVFRSALADPVSQWLLKRGRVKSAMRFRALASHGAGAGCSSGKCS
jgi:hypothetical protein